MVDRTDDLVVTLLRAIRGDIADLKTGQLEIKERLGVLEGFYASMSRRVDRIDSRIERIETRLDLVERS